MAKSPTIAVIGAGNLGGALLAGLLDAGVATKQNLIAVDTAPDRRSKLRETLGLERTLADASEVVTFADVLILSVKPHQIAGPLAAMAPLLSPQQLLISMAAAVPISFIEAQLDGPQPIVRAMPNICMTVHASATALASNSRATEEHKTIARDVFASVGEVIQVDETQLHAVTALSGSGPAYAFLLIEALTSGGVKCGLPHGDALRLAAQTFYGAAKLVLQGKQHPGQLRDQVTTPGGTTIYGLHELELAGVRAALASAVDAAMERSIELGRRYEDSEDEH